MMLLTINVSDLTWLNQQPGNRAVSAQRLIKHLGSHNGIILEVKRITTSPKWNSPLMVLAPDLLWFFVSNMFWRKYKR